jgi:two-component system NtrC family sensor kinase
MKPRTSLRGKITFGYYAVGTLIVGLSLYAFVELSLIKEKVLARERVSDFFDAALEIRRFEKNYFLYRQAVDYQENVAYSALAHDLLDKNAADFTDLLPPLRLETLRTELKNYASLMAAYARGGKENEVLAQNIRKSGKEIVTAAEEIARAERQQLQSSLDRHRRNLVISIIVLTLLIVVIGRLLSSMVVRPLKETEESMQAVAAGKLNKIDISAPDREIASLTAAFNHVLQELDLRQKHLLRSEKLASLGTLLSGVAHELNNPLSNISSSCQILTEEISESGLQHKKELLEQIDEQTIRARNIVRSLLDFAGDREFKKETVNLLRLTNQTVRFLKGQIPPQMSLTVDIPLDLAVEADKQRLQQALLNLIKNAIETLNSAGEIHLRANKRHASSKATWETDKHYQSFGKCENRGEMVDIEIHDSGHGIPPEVLPRIFDPFFTTKEIGKGSGLGLFIVYEIVEQHGGCIMVDSHPGKGTTFCIRLPLANTQETVPHD